MSMNEEKRPVPIEVVVKQNDEAVSSSDSDVEEYHDASDSLHPDDSGATAEPASTSQVIAPWSDEAELRARLSLGDREGLQISYEQHIQYDESKVDDLEGEDFFCLPSLDTAKNLLVKTMWEASWKVTHFQSLPDWLKDNDFLKSGHRPPLPSYNACLKSIFRIHTETGNIWTHMLGCATFIGVAAYFLSRPETEVQYQEKVVFSVFFISAILCLGFSSAFHTVSCHSVNVTKLFSKLDYVGIALLIVGSFVPWLFYGFYCRRWAKIFYTTFIAVLGVISIIVSLFDRFSHPKHRPTRAIVFVSLGLSGVIPCIHYFVTDGFVAAIQEASFGWLMLMAALYISGAVLYALRVPERFYPGKFDIWCQSHQIFHLFVVAAAFVHYHGITEMAVVRLSGDQCDTSIALSSAVP
ncbi:hypothetical protein D918_08668 [Trichuris suis]|nr:hypothetical protein D918_08668 [Trichuris suis]